jgi:putative transcriptional regulator
VIGLTSTGSVDLSDDPDSQLLGDSSLRLFAGSAGWGAAQLEREIDEGSWWVFEAEPDDVQSSDPSGLWARVLRRQGGRTAWFALATANPTFN